MAFLNIFARAIEASGRGFWDDDEVNLAKLQEWYQAAEDELEGVTA